MVYNTSSESLEGGSTPLMDQIQSTQLVNTLETGEELLYFWALGDLHYSAYEEWHAFHAQRLQIMYRDLRALWSEEGTPAFCVSPGDIVEISSPENYELAKKELTSFLGNIPFYPGIGNHELWSENEEDEPAQLIQDYSAFWGKPTRYYWMEGGVLCIMLDPLGYPEPRLTEETLSFLKTALAKHPKHRAVIFSHCPLYNTVLDRDPERILDYHSLDPFFYIQNSEEVRALLGKFPGACLYLSGHTHSGWPAPNLVHTEELGGHPVTFINLMSPWYTGFHKGASLGEDRQTFMYRADEPDLIVSFAVRIYRERAVIRLRDHAARAWMAEWVVPVR